MIGILTALGGFGLKFLARTVGTHLFSSELKSLSVGAVQIVIECLGLRGIVGLILGLGITHAGFRAGIKDAIFSLF